MSRDDLSEIARALEFKELEMQSKVTLAKLRKWLVYSRLHDPTQFSTMTDKVGGLIT